MSWWYQNSKPNHFLGLSFVSKAKGASHGSALWCILFPKEGITGRRSFLLIPSWPRSPPQTAHRPAEHFAHVERDVCLGGGHLFVVLKKGDMPKLGRLPFYKRGKGERPGDLKVRLSPKSSLLVNNAYLGSAGWLFVVVPKPCQGQGRPTALTVPTPGSLLNESPRAEITYQ